MSRFVTELFGWIIIAGVMLALAPFLAFRAGIQLWRRVELHFIFHNDAVAQEKARWHLR